MTLDKGKTLLLIITAILASIIIFIVGYFVGRSVDENFVRKYPKPVVGEIYNPSGIADRIPVSSIEISENYTIITTDKGEKFVTELSVTVHENEYYYDYFDENGNRIK